ncbi:response regulator [Pedobacter changchengzhani]|uniref:histidine kinase n=1 Tax=Pedobacter changchengzhani TaxID=2529274 RepID=A0A4R5MLZ6_9SPHI|nr:ATP-binding protein [Pedobacter changchengzhani]TDG36285.1 response regulator [Pedobacter changchengzhani]
MKSIQSSAVKYLLVVFLILLIFAITAKLYINFSKISLFKSSTEIIEVKKDFSRLDSCIFKLYSAENNSRMYVVTGDKKYYQAFLSEISEVSVAMDSIALENQHEKPLSDGSFKSLITQKKIRTDQFIKLKYLADSLINFSVNFDKKLGKLNPVNTIFSTRQFKSIVKIDTLKPGAIAQPKKKFFGRILAAINDKGAKGKESEKSTLLKTTITADTSIESKNFNKLQLKEINKFYASLYSVNNKLKAKERDLLDINHKLIITIVDGLKIYKSGENSYYTNLQNSANSSVRDVLNNLDKFTVVLILLLIGLLLFMFYAIYHLYKNEQQLIKQTKKASLYALSKSRFLANMSHEIRTPLNSIVGFSEQLSQVDLQPQQKEQLKAIRNSSIMLLDVVNDILDFSKYETGKVVLDSTPFSPLVAINDVFDGMKVQASKKQIDFVNNVNIDKDLFILGDALRLKQVVMNLLNNAIKFTKEGSVTILANAVKSSTKNITLKVSIIDTGIGINKLDQRLIFDEFAQAYYSSTKEKQQGTGLGLAICKRIVDFHKGDISVTSEEGKGSTFTFELPYQMVVNLPQQIEKKILSAADIAFLRGKRALLADDNILNILLASTILKKYEIIFDAAYDGKEALELFKDQDYDIVLTDIQMPEMGGIELTKKIRAFKNRKKSAVPILGITANVMQDDRIKYLDSGMSELVLKPFMEQELLKKMLKFLK